MKFPQIFRTTQPMRFDIKPRYYDPVKEEIQQRTSRIKKELQAEGKLPPEAGNDGVYAGYDGSSIRGAFTGGSQIKGRQSSALTSAGMIRLVIFVLLIGSLFGYIYYGPEAIYAILYGIGGVVLLLLFFRIRRQQRR
ncbi:hypothetical protein [Cecembia lonarensis]|uniref:Uncharacterized protein n=1 Tax=Cecembia lonarensis (strain CCUG 58316 / KCTC 22772 / LW9) TaxID=1225176 RepID=K1L0M7_CECL9|nr:hypothetical protein [Cecembia lonarensis]EKB48316.1 hypothetical protein B879_03090 [Cecembia lonarensis LW9]